MISIVVAYSNNNVIGRNNKMPWTIRGDLEFFKNLTMGNVVIMGRKTHESIGKILFGRINIVISRENKNLKDYKKQEGLYFTDSIESALSLGRKFIENSNLSDKILKKENDYESSNLGNKKFETFKICETKDSFKNIEKINFKISNDILSNEIWENESAFLSMSYENSAENISKDIDKNAKIYPKEIFIIGGQSIYEQTIDIADKIYVTRIYHEYEGDKFFPHFDKQRYDIEILDEVDTPIRHKFILYKRKDL